MKGENHPTLKLVRVAVGKMTPAEQAQAFTFTNAITHYIELDTRLKQQRQVIAAYPALQEGRASLQIPAQHWWWDLGQESAPSLIPAVSAYEQILRQVQTRVEQKEIPTAILLDLLIARDTLQVSLDQSKSLQREQIAKIIALDENLKGLGICIARNRDLEAWKHYLYPQAHHWWWDFTNPIPLLHQTIERYASSLQAVEQTNTPSSEQLLELLQARDGVEQARQGQDPLPAEESGIKPGFGESVRATRTTRSSRSRVSKGFRS